MLGGEAIGRRRLPRRGRRWFVSVWSGPGGLNGRWNMHCRKDGPALLFFTWLLIGIVGAALAPLPWSGRVRAATFPIVTAGALGAAFKYEVVAMYQWPLVAAAVLTLVLAG